MARFRVLAPGLLTSVQDLGRHGYEHLGVMVGGVLDDFAATWANRLVGNLASAPVLEATLLGPTLEALDDGCLSLAGADLDASVDGVPWTPGTVRQVSRGSVVRFAGTRQGARAYIAFPDGIDVPEVLGSCATDLVAGFGGLTGRPLRAGDVLRGGDRQVADVRAPVPTCLLRDAVRILPGVRLDAFPTGTLDALMAHTYTVSPHSDRVGLRLVGPAVPGAPPRGDMLSEGMVIGSVQLPPGGEPLVLLKSRGTIGGYPTLAHVITADLPSLGQLVPGDHIRFAPVTLPEALTALRELQARLAQPVVPVGGARPGDAATPPAGRTLVRAPLWCTVYRSRSPGQAALVEPGQHIRAGEPLAVLDVMKSFSELTSPVDGTVLAIRFADGETVEEGRPLFDLAVTATSEEAGT